MTPSFNTSTIPKYMEDLKKGIVKPLPMGAYEYHYCVEYLKMIRHELWENRKNFETLTLVFGSVGPYHLVIVPVEDCLEMVAKEAGFEVTSEKDNGENYSYVLKSKFWKK